MIDLASVDQEPIQRELWNDVSRYFQRADAAEGRGTLYVARLAKRLSLASWQLEHAAAGGNIDDTPSTAEQFEAYRRHQISRQNIVYYQAKGYVPLDRIPTFRRLLEMLKKGEQQAAPTIPQQ